MTANPTSTASTGSAHPPMTHLPAQKHGAIQQLFDGVWFVRGVAKLPMLVPVKITRSMTIVRGVDGLVLFNSMRLTEAGLAELDALGEVTHVVRLAGFHGRDDGFYRERYGAQILAIEGQAYVRGLGKPGPSYLEPDAWLTADSPLPIADASLRVIGSSTPTEALCLLAREGGVLIAGDSLQNTPVPDEFCNLPGRLAMKRFGFLVAHNVGPGWLEHAKPSAAEVRGLLDLDFENVLPGHGTEVIGGAKEKYRPALEGPLAGCHE